MDNKDILNVLKNCNDSDNYQKCKELLPQWDNSVAFPSDLSIRDYIKMHKWSAEDLDKIGTELMIDKYLAPHIKDVYFKMKEFRDNPRFELTRDQEAYGRIMGYNLEWNDEETDEQRQDKKAAILYEHSISRFFNNSQLKGNKDDNEINS